MTTIRVLIVDDAVLMRKRMTAIVESDPDLSLAGVAPNGQIAVSKLKHTTADVVLLDFDLPDMSLPKTVCEMRKLRNNLPIIIYGTMSGGRELSVVDALSCGVTDYISRSPGLGPNDEQGQRFHDEVISAIKLHGGKLSDFATRKGQPPAPARLVATPGSARHVGPVPGAALTPFPDHPQRIDIVAIGVSTGGPIALAVVFKALPATLRVPIVIVQHMPALMTKFLAERLSAESPIKVAEGVTGGELKPGHAWLAPGDYHMIVCQNGIAKEIRLHQQAPVNSCRPAVDVLFESVAETYGPHALAVVLTGMGQDGLRGCQRIREAGGTVFAQDEATSVVWGMPGFVAKAGLAHKVLPVDQIAREIADAVLLRRQGQPSP